MSLSVTSFDQLERTLAPNYPDCHLLGARFRRLLVTQQDQERLVHVGTSKLRSTADELSEKLLSVEGDKDKHTESKWGILRLGESRTRFQGNHFVYRIHFILGDKQQTPNHLDLPSKLWHFSSHTSTVLASSQKPVMSNKLVYALGGTEIFK